MAAPSGVCAVALVAAATTSATPTIIVDHRLTSTAALIPDSMEGEHISGVTASLRNVEGFEGARKTARVGRVVGRRPFADSGGRSPGWRLAGVRTRHTTPDTKGLRNHVHESPTPGSDDGRHAGHDGHTCNRVSGLAVPGESGHDSHGERERRRLSVDAADRRSAVPIVRCAASVCLVVPTFRSAGHGGPKGPHYLVACRRVESLS